MDGFRPNPKEICNIESEAGVIATILVHPDFTFYSDTLRPNYFTDPANAYLYYAVGELAKMGVEQVDEYNITNFLNIKKGTKQVGEDVNAIITVPSLQELIATAGLIARSDVDDYLILVKSVVDCAFRRSTLKKLVECEKLCMNEEEEEIEQKIYSTLDDVMMQFSSNNSVPMYADIVDDIWEEIKERQRGETSAIEFPFPELNKYVVMEPGEAIAFAAGAKIGKSAMLLTCTVDLLKKDKSVLVIDSEISTKLYTIRMLSHLTGIKFNKIRSGSYSQEEEQQLELAINWLKTRKLMHIYMPIFDSKAVMLAAKKAKHQMDLDVLCVDYLKATGSNDDAFAVYQEIDGLQVEKSA